MTPEQIAEADTEHAHQTALFCWAAANQARFPELRWMHAIPNGGLRSKAQAGKLKAEGVKSGVPDVFLPVARGKYHGLYIEMKKPALQPVRGGRGGVSDEQSEFIAAARANGYAAAVCYSWDHAKNLICRYLDENLCLELTR